MKMPAKLGKTKSVPMKYQVLRLPGGQESLSDPRPTIGVVIPSAICPERMAAPVAGALKFTTYCK